jgi:hypothetical protein
MLKRAGLLAVLLVPVLAGPQPREWGCMIDGRFKTEIYLMG